MDTDIAHPQRGSLEYEDHASRRFAENELEAWNAELQPLKGVAQERPALALSAIIHVVNRDKPGALNTIYVYAQKAAELVDADNELRELLRSASNDGNFKRVICADPLAPPLQSREPDPVDGHIIQYDFGPLMDAVVRSWLQTFRGTADVLRNKIRRHMKPSTSYSQPYARFALYCQSSGTGKSRMVDELAKEIICIPINLGTVHGDVFPPEDIDACLWFAATSVTQQQCANKAQAFLSSAFAVALEQLQEIDEAIRGTMPGVTGGISGQTAQQRVGLLASHFRRHMSDGMHFGAHGAYRMAFYKSVIERAKNLLHNTSDATAGRDSMLVNESAERLCRFLDPARELQDEPLVILCFDEAHKLDNPSSAYKWTAFKEVCRALRLIIRQPIFSLFLSTTAIRDQVLPPPVPPMMSSGQAEEPLKLFPTFLSTPFDALVVRLPKSECTLERVASTEFMAHFGRPLFGGMYDAGDDRIRKDIIAYAGMKLMCARADPEHLSVAQSLAWIGVRIPFDFRPYVIPAFEDKELTLVAAHLRLLLYAGPSFEGVLTACGSEPLLAEASYEFLIERRWSYGEPVKQRQMWFAPLSPLPALHYHLNFSGLDLGTGGATVAAALLLDARDRATTFPLAENELPGSDRRRDDLRFDGIVKRRIVTVPRLLEALIAATPCGDATPAECQSEEAAGTPLATAFKDCFVYFNHFVKATGPDVMSQLNLWRAMLRGAAYICGNNPGDVDIVIPCVFGPVLAKDKISAIMVRVGTTRRFSGTVEHYVFSAMDPYLCGVFAEEVVRPPPVLRMMLALGAREASVTWVTREQRASAALDSDTADSSARFTSYDVWCAGASRSTFGVLHEGDQDALAGLLKRLHGPRDLEEAYLREGDLLDAVRAMQPLTTKHHASFERFAEPREEEEEEEEEEAEVY